MRRRARHPEAETSMTGCGLCGGEATSDELSEAGWVQHKVLERMAAAHPTWRRDDGACPACVQDALLEVLLESGGDALHAGIQRVWPLDAEAAFGLLPTPLRLHADPRFRGRGITLAQVDAGFYPHRDLVRPRNRIRAWVDAAHRPSAVRRFGESEVAYWPRWNAGEPYQWHGLMTSASAAGNGALSHGLYRGLASEADLVLVQTREPNGRIPNRTIARALRWLAAHARELDLRVVSISVAGDPVATLAGNAVDEAVAELVSGGVVVVAAAGNDGVRRLVPPATAPAALTIGGLDDKNTFARDELELWHSNYGESSAGALKPELVAPSLWVAAPVLPGTPLAEEARLLFARRAAGDPSVDVRIAEQRLITPHYQHVEGTSFAAPLVASVVACMLEANPGLSPAEVRELLIASAEPVPGAEPERQGAGALHAGRAVALALERKRAPS
jgi:serine protease AprX